MKAKPIVPIVLDKERHLMLNMNSMVAFEDATGKSLMRGIDTEKLTVKDLRALLWACLIHEDKELTIEEVGDMIHTGNMEEVTNQLAKAWEVSMPEGDGGDPLATTPTP